MRTIARMLALIVSWMWMGTASADEKAVCTAAYVSAQLLRAEHRLLAARDQLRTCARQECDPMMRGQMITDCLDWLAQVNTAVPSVVFEVTNLAGQNVAGTMDGQPITEAPIEVDPGEHMFVFEAPGLSKTIEKIVAVEGIQNRREVIVLETPKPLVKVATTILGPPVPHVLIQSKAPPFLSYASFGVSGAGLVLGIAAGLVADGKHAALSHECNNSAGTCASQYSGDIDSFHATRTASTVGYVIGALGIAVGGLLWFALPRTHGTVATILVGPGSVGIGGKF